MERNRKMVLWGLAVLVVLAVSFVVFGQFYGQSARTEIQVPPVTGSR